MVNGPAVSPSAATICCVLPGEQIRSGVMGT